VAPPPLGCTERSPTPSLRDREVHDASRLFRINVCIGWTPDVRRSKQVSDVKEQAVASGYHENDAEYARYAALGDEKLVLQYTLLMLLISAIAVELQPQVRPEQIDVNTNRTEHEKRGADDHQCGWLTLHFLALLAAR
jgi:hypothetical protein